MYVKTDSGSMYEIDLEKRTWCRVVKGDKYISVVPLRTQSGTIEDMSKIVIGKPMVLIGPPLVEGTIGRMITTSEVVEIIPDVPDEDPKPTQSVCVEPPIRELDL